MNLKKEYLLPVRIDLSGMHVIYNVPNFVSIHPYDGRVFKTNQSDQPSKRLPWTCRRRRWSVLHVPSAEVSRNPANSVAVLAAVLGLRTVVMPATQILVTHGARASRPAKVSCRVSAPYSMYCGGYAYDG